jgi:hypothetical protein
MKLFKFLAVVLTVYSLAFMACSSNDSNANDSEESTSTITTSESESDGGGLTISVDDGEEKVNIKIGGDNETVDFRELKKLMPEELAGLERTSHEGERAGIMGFNISSASATYEEDDKRIEVSINDIAGMGAAISQFASWSNIEVDRESDSGYERTTTIDGHPAFEKYDGKTKKAEYSVIVDDRFIVTMNAKNLSQKDAEKAFRTIKWKDLTSK